MVQNLDPDGKKRFSVLHAHPDWPWSHPAFYIVDTKGLSEHKVAGVWHWPLTSI